LILLKNAIQILCMRRWEYTCQELRYYLWLSIWNNKNHHRGKNFFTTASNRVYGQYHCKAGISK